MRDDTISRQEAMDALWKALYEYEDKKEKQVQESDELDMKCIMSDKWSKWMMNDRVLVQNMNDIDRQTILNLPPARQWTPCSEGLPLDRDWVFGVFKEKDTGWINPIPFVCEYIGKKTSITTDDFWILKEHEDEREFGFDYYRNLECVVWMPLPNPWKGESDETD